jgi:hypothetical protein
MKHLSILAILFVSAILIETSCRKQTVDQITDSPAVIRKIQFTLYTQNDFSDNNENITFELFIQNSRNKILLDSTLMSMKIKDIPDFTHKLIIEKTVPNNDTSLLKVGFKYSIENVGNSWHLESFKAGELFKIVDFNFQ